MTELPCIMAIVKPYDLDFSHNSWRGTVSPMNNKDAPFADIAARIRWHRAIEGTNQTEYARAAGLRRSQVSNWETGEQRVSVDGALKLRRRYGLSLDFIYDGSADTLPMTLRKAWRDKP